MAFVCPHCGEELIGAVNRCWACARPITAAQRESFEIVEAAVHDGSDDDEPAESETPDESAETEEPGSPTRRPPTVEESPESHVRALPWQEARLVGDRRDQQSTTERLRALERQKAAIGGSIGSVVVGVASLIAGYFTVMACIGSLVGIILGIWGCQSRRWGWAVFGIAASVLALFLAVTIASLRLYEAAHGHLPWESPAAAETEMDF